jgi:hypothetical protein
VLTGIIHDCHHFFMLSARIFLISGVRTKVLIMRDEVFVDSKELDDRFL